MLQDIRDRAHGWITGILFFIMILSLGLLGIRSWLGVSDVRNTAAEVNGVSISRAAVEVTLQRLQRQLQAAGQTLSASDLPLLRSSALDSLVDLEIMKQAAISDGFRVSSDQTAARVMQMPQFQEKGVFSPDRFEVMTANTGFTPASFMDLVATTMVIDQPRSGIFASAVVMPDEVSGAVGLLGQKRTFSWLALSPKDLASSLQIRTPSAEDLQAWYDAHSSDYIVPEQVSVDYLFLSGQKLADEALVSKLRDQLANIAYEHPESLQPAAKALGFSVQTSGFFTRDKAAGQDPVSGNTAVRAAAFSDEVLQLNNNSDVIEVGPESYVVIHLHAHENQKVLPFSAVRNQVEATLQSQAAAAAMKKAAGQIQQGLQSGSLTMAGLASQYHQSLQTATLQDSKNAASGGMGKVILAAAFHMPAPVSARGSFGVFPMMDAGNSYAVVALQEVRAGVAASGSADYQAMADQLATSIAGIEYGSWHDSLKNQAKVKMMDVGSE